MIQLTIKAVVLEKMREAFPTPPNSAKRALDKYKKALEERLTESLNMGRTDYERKMKFFSIPKDKLAAEGSRIGPDRVRLQTWLRDNNLSLFETAKIGTSYSGLVSVVKLTDLVTMTDDTSASHLTMKSAAELEDFLNVETETDKEFVNRLLPELAQLDDAQVLEKYHIAEIDIESVKSYIRWLLTEATLMTKQQIDTNLRHAQIILRVAQFTNGIFPQKMKPSFFGRTYYEGISVQGVHKTLRKAMLGNCYEYDIKSSAISWKMGFAKDCYAKMKTKGTFKQEFSAMLQYLERKDDFTKTVIAATFRANSNSKPDHQVKLVKEAITALSFGARLTVRGWKDDSGNWTNPAIVDILKNPDERKRFADSKLVVKFRDEQKALDTYISETGIKANPLLLTYKELQTKSGRTSKSKVVAYQYQHAETIVMDIVRKELGILQREVLANVHDAIVIRSKLSDYDREKIEYKMRDTTGIEYWRLGETKYERYEVVSDEVKREEERHKQHIAAESERAKNYKSKNI